MSKVQEKKFTCRGPSDCLWEIEFYFGTKIFKIHVCMFMETIYCEKLRNFQGFFFFSAL